MMNKEPRIGDVERADRATAASSERKRCEQTPVIAGMQLNRKSVCSCCRYDVGTRELHLHAEQRLRGEKYAVKAARGSKGALHEVAGA